jgi:cytochrome c553
MVRRPCLPSAQALRVKARCAGQIMRAARLQLALAVATPGLIIAAISLADRAGAASDPRWSLQPKIEYCTDCHGASGRGYRGYFPMPRLAGQTTEYFENQLRAFAGHGRGNDFPVPLSKVHGHLSAAMESALAAHFADLDPDPFGRAPRELVPRGRKIFKEGVPDANVPACSSCHGAQAEGNGAIPRLAGQLYPYTVRQLANWDKERGQNPTTASEASIMRPIAHSLTRSQIEAVAAYLSYLR